jgi:RNA polymerase sigma-70 factor (ECF subfamily)
MRWNYKDFDQSPELSSDIEWMIQSGQVTTDLLVETLINQYYPSVFLLAISLLNDRSAALTVTRETFIRLVLNLHQYRSTIGVHDWVHQTAYQICIKQLRGEGIWRYLDHLLSNPGQFTDPIITPAPTESDRVLWQRVDALEQTDKTLIILRYGNNWELSEIAYATGFDERTVQERLHASLEHVFREQDIDEGEPHQILLQSLGSRWRYLAGSQQATEQLVKQVSQRTGKKRRWRRDISTTREMVLLGLALLFVILIIWGGNRYLTQSDSNLDPSGTIPSQYTLDIHIWQPQSQVAKVFLPDVNADELRQINRSEIALRVTSPERARITGY